MSLKSIKSNLGAERGFTIVELLIVVVVIAILAAITIVSYSNITGRANKSAAQAAVASFQKKAELYAADGTTGKYPLTKAVLTGTPSASYYLSTDAFDYVTNPVGSLDATTGTKKVAVRVCASGSPANLAAITSAPTTITGLQIYFFDYDTNLVTTSPATVGVTSGGTVLCPAS